MKRKITFFTILFLLPYTLFGLTWTVSNNPNIPGQFTEISTAIADASTTAGDTLLVAGSTINYGDFTLNEPFVIIGAGINNPNSDRTVVYNVNLTTTAGFSPSGARLIGLYIDYSISMTANDGSKTIENIVIERCWLDSYVHFYGTTGTIFRNDTIRNCVMEDGYIYFDQGTYESIEIHNNLFDNATFNDYYSTDLSNVIVSNNVFIDEASNIFDGVENMVVTDNIFFEASPQGCVGCAFTNNTSYGALDNTLPGTDNIGSGNEERDPKFVNYTIADASFTFEAGYDFHLLAISLDDDSGTAGTERGIYGGAMPVELGSSPAIPQMTEVSFPDNASSVKEGGSLNVRLKAKKQN